MRLVVPEETDQLSKEIDVDNEFLKYDKEHIERSFRNCSFVLAACALIGIGLLAINWPW